MSEESTKLSRNELRAKTLGAPKHFKSEIVEFNGVKLEVREPTVEGWLTIVDKARANDEGELSIQEFTLWTVIYCTYVPGTQERVYDEADYDDLKTQPRDGFVNLLSTAATRLIEANQETVVKNSDETAKD